MPPAAVLAVTRQRPESRLVLRQVIDRLVGDVQKSSTTGDRRNVPWAHCAMRTPTMSSRGSTYNDVLNAPARLVGSATLFLTVFRDVRSGVGALRTTLDRCESWSLP